jgi:ABC-type polysaccharide/polyol phosphate export permease
LTGVIDGFRAALLNADVEWRSLFVSFGITLALLVASSFVFKHIEDEFADVV